MLSFFLIVSSSLLTLTPFQEKSFLSWMRETNQLFTGAEYHLRLGIWLSNQRFVQAHNSGSASFKLAMNHLAALTPSEYQSLLGSKHISFQTRSYKKDTKTKPSYPLSWSWCDLDSVCNGPQDQGSCSSSWAFGAIESIESNYAIKSGKLPKLSEQNLIDCVTSCNGCNGGSDKDAIDYIVNSQNGYVEYENDYPYVAYDQSCSFDQSKSVQVVSGYVSISKGDEEELAERIFTRGVASVSIDASNPSFQLYSGGIYDEPKCSSTNVDHTVSCVGFGVDSSSGVRYWIVKNSWGTKWGEQGYIRMIKDKGNQCGEATNAIIASPV